MTDIKAIAEGLSATMRGLLADLPENGLDAALFWNTDKRLRTYKSLSRRGLADPFGAVTLRGSQVRDYLKGQDQ
jgi:hypothetical protein